MVFHRATNLSLLSYFKNKLNFKMSLLCEPGSAHGVRIQGASVGSIWIRVLLFSASAKSGSSDVFLLIPSPPFTVTNPRIHTAVPTQFRDKAQCYSRYLFLHSIKQTSVSLPVLRLTRREARDRRGLFTSLKKICCLLFF